MRQMGISELNALSVVRDENGRLKKLVADLTIDKNILHKILSKNNLKSTHLRCFIQWIRESYELNVKHTCELVMLIRSSYIHRSRPVDYATLTRRLRELAGLETEVWI